MDYKPVHIITNNWEILSRVLAFSHIEVQIASKDYTEEEGEHYHVLVHWPKTKKAYKPSKTTAIRRCRRLQTPRCECYDKSFNTKCPVCGTFYKLIWCKSDDHAVNVFQYIERKVQERPTWRLH